MEKIKSPDTTSELYLYHPGEIVLKEGQGSSIIYILRRGVLGIYKGENKVSEIKGMGVVFGEMSSILGKPRTVTVKAEKNSEIMIYRGGIEGIIKNFPSITKKILVVLAERLESQTAKYSTLQSKCEFILKQLAAAKSKLEEERRGKEAVIKDSGQISEDIFDDTSTHIEYMAIPPSKKP